MYNLDQKLAELIGQPGMQLLRNRASPPAARSWLRKCALGYNLRVFLEKLPILPQLDSEQVSVNYSFRIDDKARTIRQTRGLSRELESIFEGR